MRERTLQQEVDERRLLQDQLAIAVEVGQMGTWDLDLLNDFSGHRSLRHDQIFGYDTPQAQWGQAIAKQHVIEEDRATFDAAFARAGETGELDFAVRIRWPDGSLHWMGVRGRFYFDANGRPVRGVGVNFDITERKKVEQELKVSKDLVQTVFDVSLNPIAYHKAVRDAAGTIVDFEFQLENQEARKYAMADRTGKRYSEAYPGIKDTVVFKLYCDVVETGNELNTEVQLNLKGIDRWFHLMAVKLDDGLVATALDVTGRKKAEQEILQLKDEIAWKATNKYDTLFNTIDEGLSVLELIYDASGKPVDMRWVETNPAFEKITGLQNVTGRLTSEFVPSEEYWLATYDRVVKTGEPIRYENYHAGIKQWYRTHTARVGGPASRVVANVFENITERKRRELNATLLNEIGKDLSVLSTPDAIIAAVGARLGEFLEASSCIFADVDEAKNEATIHHGWHTADVPILKQTFRLADYFGEEFRRAGRAGEAVIVRDTGHDDRANDEAYARLQLGAFVTVPFQRNGRWTANITVTSREARDWRADEIELLQEIAARVFPRIERTRAEAALRQSEERLRGVLDGMGEGFGLLAPDFTILEHNREALRLDGRAREEIIGGSHWEVYPGTENSELGRLYKKAMAERVPVTLEHRYAWAADRALWLEMRAYPTADGSLAVFWRDITDRREAQEALRASEEKYRTLFDSMDEGVSTLELIFDENERAVDYIFVEQNAALTKQTGLTSDIIGKRVSEIYPDLEAYWFEAFERVVKTGVPERHEYYIAALDSWFDIYTTRVADSDSREVVCIYNNITERKQRERQQEFLLKFSDDLRTLAEEKTIEETGLRMLAEFFRLDRAYIFVLHPSEDRAVVRAEQRNENLASLVGEVRMSDFPETVRQIEDETLVIHDIDNDARLSDLNRRALAAVNLQSFVCASVRKGERSVIWSLAAASVKPRTWTQYEIELIEIAAERLWTAIERAKAEERLRQSEARRQLALDAAEMGTFLYHVAEDRGEPDARMLALFGLPTDSTLNLAEALTNLIHPDDRARYAEAVAHATDPAGDGLLQSDIRVRQPDGSVRWVAVTAQVLFDGQPRRATRMYGVAVDISARKQAEEALRVSAARIRIAVEAARLATWEWHLRTGEIHWNEQHFLLFGMTPQDQPMTAADFFSHVHPDDRTWLGATVQAAIDERRVYQAEFRICKEDGSLRWMNGYGRVVAEENGESTQMSGVMFDITERKEAEEALRASEARQALILETMAEGVVTIDREGRFFSANAAAERILGVSRRELIGLSVMEPPFRRFALDGEPWGQQPPLTEVAAANNHIFHNEYVIERRDGSRVTISRNITALRTPDGALLGFVSTLSDITEQQRMEASLRDSEERFRAVANLVPDLLWDSEPDGSSNWYNQRWLEYTGQSLVEASGWGWTDAIHPDDRAVSARRYQEAVTTGQPLRQEHRIRRHDGEYRWFVVNAFPLLDESEQVSKMYGAATDIHEQRVARAILEQRVVERTHELATVSAMRQHLLDRLLTVQEDERRRIAHDLHDSLGQHLVALNVGLKTVEEIDGCPQGVSARIGALRAMVVRMDEEVERLAFALRPPALDDLGLADALRRHVAVWSADSHIPVDLHLRGLTATRLPSAVETAIFRVMQEALTNIRKYAAATHVSLILEWRSHEVVMIIEDNGCGFDVVAALATAGRRLHLGLSGMRERAGLVGGHLDVESAPGAGATVYLHVPLAER